MSKFNFRRGPRGITALLLAAITLTEDIPWWPHPPGTESERSGAGGPGQPRAPPWGLASLCPVPPAPLTARTRRRTASWPSGEQKISEDQEAFQENSLGQLLYSEEYYDDVWFSNLGLGQRIEDHFLVGFYNVEICGDRWCFSTCKVLIWPTEPHLAFSPPNYSHPVRDWSLGSPLKIMQFLRSGMQHLLRTANAV